MNTNRDPTLICLDYEDDALKCLRKIYKINQSKESFMTEPLKTSENVKIF